MDILANRVLLMRTPLFMEWLESNGNDSTQWHNISTLEQSNGDGAYKVSSGIHSRSLRIDSVPEHIVRGMRETYVNKVRVR